MTRTTLIEDRDTKGVFRVETILDDGGVEVALFSGPNAKDRAIVFAGSDWHDGWDDPEDWCGIGGPRP